MRAWSCLLLHFNSGEEIASSADTVQDQSVNQSFQFCIFLVLKHFQQCKVNEDKGQGCALARKQTVKQEINSFLMAAMSDNNQEE